MDILLCINNTDLENSIQDLKNVEVLNNINDTYDAVDFAEKENPDIVIVSNACLGASTQKLIEKLSTSKFFTGRIVLIVDTIKRSTWSLIETLTFYNKYDFLIGDFLIDDLEKLIKNTRSVREYQSYIKEYKKEFTDFSSLTTRENKVYCVEKSVVAVHSPCSTGKSFVVFVLAKALKSLGFSVAVIDLDNNSAQEVYFNIESQELASVSIKLKEKKYSNACVNCCRTSEDIALISLPSNAESQIEKESLQDVINSFRSVNDIVLIDCPTYPQYGELTKTAIALSTDNILILDTDIVHCLKSLEFISELSTQHKLSESIVVINKIEDTSQAFKEVLKQLKDTEFEFRSIVYLRDYGYIPNELKLYNTDYVDMGDEIFTDTNELLKALNIYLEQKEEIKKGLLGSIFDKFKNI